MRTRALILLVFANATACSLDESGAFDASTSGDVVASDQAANDVGPVDGAADSDAPFADVQEAATPASPGDLNGLELWLVSDRGLAVANDGGSDAGLPDSGQVLLAQWIDQSAHQYVAYPKVPSTMPTLTLGDQTYGGANSVAFQSTDTLAIDNFAAVPQPFTVVLIGNTAAGGPANLYFLSADNPVSALYRGALPSAPQDSIQLKSPSPTAASTSVVSQPSIVAAVFNGANSVVYVSTTTSVGLNPGIDGIGGTLTVGSIAPGQPLYSLSGKLTEVAIFNRVLPSSDVARINAYATSRYGITLK